MRPTTPRLHVSHDVGPTSPPQTPTTASPVFNRKSSSNKGGFPPLKTKSKYPMPQDSNIQPLGTGHSFSYNRPPFRPEDLSPRSSSSSSADSEAASSDSGSPPRSASSGRPDVPVPPFIHQIRAIITTSTSALSIEECTDFDDSDDDRLGVIRPHAIEDAESERSRSRSRTRPELDPHVVRGINGLNCDDTESDDSDIDEEDARFQEMLRMARLARRRKRMSSGSIGKRTISESIGSDTDLEDLQQQLLEMSEAGSSARRLRRRVGDRWSLQFPDPPPRIDETEEYEEIDGESLAKELPYYNYVSMEIDSP